MSHRPAQAQTPPQDFMTLEDAHTSGAYPKRPLVLVQGEGSRVWDDQGRAYLDMTSGQGVALLGHSHPAVAEAVREQAQHLITCPEIFYNDQRARLYETLCRILPEGFSRFFLCNSGAEAVEGALKLARLTSHRSGVLAAKWGFHGRTFGALSATWNPKYREPFQPLVPEFDHFTFNDIDSVAGLMGPNTAAVLLEVVQGEGGVIPGRPEFFQEVRELCDRTGTLLIFDEIQTGLGRTGRWFAFQHHGVEPDILCLGKGIAGGLPMGLVAWRERLGRLPQGSHGSTFGGNPLVCAAAEAALTTLLEQKLPARAEGMGRILIQGLKNLDSPMVRDVRGLGLMTGVDLRCRVTPLLKGLQGVGVLALPAGPTVLRLLPPLTITRDELMISLGAIQAALDDLEAGVVRA